MASEGKVWTSKAVVKKLSYSRESHSTRGRQEGEGRDQYMSNQSMILCFLVVFIGSSRADLGDFVTGTYYLILEPYVSSEYLST